MAAPEADSAEVPFGHMPTLEPLLPPGSRDADHPQPPRHRVPDSSQELAEAASTSSSSAHKTISRLVKSKYVSAAVQNLFSTLHRQALQQLVNFGSVQFQATALCLVDQMKLANCIAYHEAPFCWALCGISSKWAAG